MNCPFCGSSEYAPDHWGYTCAPCGSNYTMLLEPLQDRIPVGTRVVEVNPGPSWQNPLVIFVKCIHDFPERLCPYCKDVEIAELKAQIALLKPVSLGEG